ncbi:hypothetical protein [Candidatus Methylacidithermus pantelleriae]|uniref:Uncharacterized protein n=1 Tax=Candidatus Methylacidithermus pantelleriae TaxID=2744239 RepID=A0A8J2FST5_9BACT|nr:hypothetical protein [Candidatus Methylacidithermus pantelleriae]CAF0700742.1 conserved hypothetical protein [Candidatus Methylacidithermus pantelleriae]
MNGESALVLQGVLGQGVKLQGRRFVCQSLAEKALAVEAAFDYRGDVTLELCDGSQVEGFVFNRTLTESCGTVELLLPGQAEPLAIPYDQIVAIAFTGKDTADGRSYEAWKAKKASERAREAQQIEKEMRAQGYL